MLYKHNSLREQGEMYVCGVLSPEQKEVLEQAKAKFSNQQTCHIPGICTNHVHGCMGFKSCIAYSHFVIRGWMVRCHPFLHVSMDCWPFTITCYRTNQSFFNLRGQFATENGDRMMQYTQ